MYAWCVFELRSFLPLHICVYVLYASIKYTYTHQNTHIHITKDTFKSRTTHTHCESHILRTTHTRCKRYIHIAKDTYTLQTGAGLSCLYTYASTFCMRLQNRHIHITKDTYTLQKTGLSCCCLYEISTYTSRQTHTHHKRHIHIVKDTYTSWKPHTQCKLAQFSRVSASASVCVFCNVYVSLEMCIHLLRCVSFVCDVFVCFVSMCMCVSFPFVSQCSDASLCMSLCMSLCIFFVYVFVYVSVEKCIHLLRSVSVVCDVYVSFVCVFRFLL